MSTNLPEGYNTINPFVVTHNALEFIKFLEQVFDAREEMQAHTMDTDGLLLHSELVIGNSRIMVADRKPDWPFTPGLLQIYVEHVDETLRRAEKLGAAIVTRPTHFYGDIFSRFVDPWDNLWWVYQYQQEFEWEEHASTDNSETWEAESEEMTYIHKTLLETMRSLGRKAIR